ncbi:hypothetical protein C0J52_00614 [Blattella germanica]|nr:hypothetical protein C0J52_00614 [Blattella germanica]
MATLIMRNKQNVKQTSNEEIFHNMYCNYCLIFCFIKHTLREPRINMRLCGRIRREVAVALLQEAQLCLLKVCLAWKY